ncbi:transmembrane protein 242 [Octopus bimaculoides]|uniref:Transmembrane protein 242 n=1 Tax=Octopus bimaculoides TaxID=37653 RepID=A0A0L8HN15_OCTBM|nr:transmembrane protein 242 [Octopus bimaculoides]XP_052821789.1 transmembrane protein 242 [Octopus bimaculoides]|eukprot:XP_014771325.1 PREDICTED: transmembrane protein 242-like [Octopus bimaculoides]
MASSAEDDDGKNRLNNEIKAEPTLLAVNNDDDKQITNQRNNRLSNLKGAAFFTSLTTASLLFGFGTTVAMAKKKDPAMFAKTLIPSREYPVTGHAFAARALAWGTLYSISGVSLLTFAVWKMLGVHNLVEFREKIQSLMPKVPKKQPQEGRTEFKNLTDLMQYIIDIDAEEKKKKLAKTNSNVSGS